jgi:tRNA threonylcarbamoyladenosine biosynthesis protein TsaE
MRIAVEIADLNATQELAKKISQKVRSGDVLALKGDLGTGKTAFARFLIQALAGTQIDVPSPSFTLLNTYELGWGQVWHYDLYRVENESALEELALEDATAHLVLIEWPEGLGRYRMPITATLEFKLDGLGRRCVHVDTHKDWL